MSISINIVAALIAFGVVFLIVLLIARVFRQKWRLTLLRIWIDLAWINIRVQIVMFTNPIQNERFVFAALAFLYFIIFRVASSGGAGYRLMGSRSVPFRRSKQIRKRLATLIWLTAIGTFFLLTQGEFIGRSFSNLEHAKFIRLDHQQNVGYDIYQQGSINIAYEYNHEQQIYDTVKFDINLDNQVDLTLSKTFNDKLIREINPYTRQQRLILYLVCTFALLALVGMRPLHPKKAKLVAPPSSPQQVSTPTPLPTTTKTLIIGAAVSLPLLGSALTLQQLADSQRDRDICLEAPDSAWCIARSSQLGIDAELFENPKFVEQLETFLQLYRECQASSCPEQKLELIVAGFEKRTAQWPDQIAKEIITENELLTIQQSIATTSFRVLLSLIPELIEESITFLETNNHRQAIIMDFQTTDTTSWALLRKFEYEVSKQIDILKLYHSLLWMTEKSVFLNNDNLKTQYFYDKNITAQHLLQLRDLAPTIDMHRTYLLLKHDQSLDESNLLTHLLLAKTVEYLYEYNPIHPTWKGIGWTLDRFGRETAKLMWGYTEMSTHLYEDIAARIMSWPTEQLDDQLSADYQAFIAKREDPENSLWTKGKGFFQMLSQGSNTIIKTGARHLLTYVEKSNLLVRLSRAHSDMLFDIGG